MFQTIAYKTGYVQIAVFGNTTRIEAWLNHERLGQYKSVDAAKAAISRASRLKKNPAPRIGTRRPRRRSQITGRAPTKRLVKRRTVNTRKGFFPNPAKLEARHYTRAQVAKVRSKNVYCVDCKLPSSKSWTRVMEFPKTPQGQKYAIEKAKSLHAADKRLSVRVVTK